MTRIDRNATSSKQRLTFDVYFRELNRLVEVSQRRSSLEPRASNICRRLQEHVKALALIHIAVSLETASVTTISRTTQMLNLICAWVLKF